LLGGDYYDYNDARYGNKRKYYKSFHRPHGFIGGCRGYGCGGGYV